MSNGRVCVMTRVFTWVCMLGLAGCVHRPVPEEPEASPPHISDWVDRLGPILGEARDCVRAHPDTGATIIGARRLHTGETAVMTRSQDNNVRVCVHDGEDVVYQKSLTLPKEELEGLPFVTLLGSTRPGETPCMSVRQLQWGIVVVGWLAVPRCEGERNAVAPREARW